MPKFKVIVSEPKKSKVQTVELEGTAAQPLIGRELGEIIEGNILNISGQKLKVTGGTDKNGIPMRIDIQGGGKKRVILSGGVGFNPKKKGERKRKLVRGRMITEETYELNMVVIEKKSLDKPKAQPKKSK
jgi:small subunit ribosomal protein S6e